MTSDRAQTGQRWESRAWQHLKQHGCELVARNFRSRFGEIDLIVTDQQTLVFCEVRYRGRGALDSAAESITAHKQRRLVKAAQFFLLKRPGWQQARMRFDVICVDDSADGVHLRWIRDAFRL